MRKRWRLLGWTALLEVLVLTMIGPSVLPDGHGVHGGNPALLALWNDAKKSNVVIDTVLSPGTNFVMEVNASDPGMVNGFDVTITYNPLVLKSTSASANSTAGLAACQKVQGCVFDGVTLFTLRKQVDNPAGTVRLSIVISDTTTPFVNGSGTFFRVSFNVLTIGPTGLNLEETVSSISNPDPVSFQAIDGFFDNRAATDFNYSISSTLQTLTVTRPVIGLNSTSTTVNVNLVSGITRTVSLSLLGLPKGGTASFSPSIGTPTFTSALTISVNSTVVAGNYTLALTGTAAVTGGLLTREAWLLLRVRAPPGSHDIAVTAMIASTSFAYAGVSFYPVKVNVTVSNLGTFQETFTVTGKANSTVIGTQSVTVASGGTLKVTFNWNTSSLVRGSYTLSALASSVPGETNTGNNSFTDGTFRIRLRGDVNNDCTVDISDIVLVTGSFHTGVGSPGYTLAADIDQSGFIDITDLTIVAGSFHASC